MRLLKALYLPMAWGMMALNLRAQDGAFAHWRDADLALQRDAGAQVRVGDFQLALPLGWVRDTATNTPGVLALRYVGADGSRGAQGGGAGLRIEIAHAQAAWPSPFAGWTAVRVGPHWTAQLPLRADGALAPRVVLLPYSDGALAIEARLAPADRAALDDLIRAVVYRGRAEPLPPPEVAGPRAFRTRAAARLPAQALDPESPLHDAASAALRLMAQGGDPALGNQVAILDHGDDALLARIHLIRAARHSIKIQTFIWRNDETGRLFLFELLAAARRGVKVQVLADHIASMRDVGLVAWLVGADPNFELRHYRPPAGHLAPNLLLESWDFILPNRTNQRMHNKLLLVDDAVFITGGRNVQNTYYNLSPGLNFRDRDVLVAGPMAAYAAASFDEYWRYEESVPSAALKDVARAIREGQLTPLSSATQIAAPDFFAPLEAALADPALVRARLAEALRPAARLLYAADPPGKVARVYTAWRRGTLARQLEEVMAGARSELLLQTPYLILDGGMLKLFRDLRAERGDVRVALSSNSYGSTDDPLTYAANFKLRKAYLEDARLFIYEFMPRPAIFAELLPRADRLTGRAPSPDEPVRGSGASDGGAGPFLCVHAKGFVVDRRVAFVGSYNFDPRSIAWNTEAGVLIEDEGVAGELARLIARDIEPANSWVVARRRAARSDADVARTAGLDTRADRAIKDLWAAKHTSSFRLRAGEAPALPETPPFYERYHDEGPFPGADEATALKQILTHLGGALADLLMPLL